MKVGDYIYYPTGVYEFGDSGCQIGLKIIKSKIEKINSVTIKHSKLDDLLPISLIGKDIFLTKKECANQIIKMCEKEQKRLDNTIEIIRYKEIPNTINKMRRVINNEKN